MESATEYQLKFIHWSFFGTLTWSGAQLGSVQSRETQVWEFLREWAAMLSVKLLALPIVIRWERGEIGDRPHCHFLMKAPDRVNIGMCFFQMHRWNERYGFAKIRLYHPLIDWARYTVKGLESASRDGSNANKYELGKFDQADRLDINPAAWLAMSRAAGVKFAPAHRTS
jgi:hypothetical protein